MTVQEGQDRSEAESSPLTAKPHAPPPRIGPGAQSATAAGEGVRFYVGKRPARRRRTTRIILEQSRPGSGS
jgi:hypothetical protein